MKWLIKIILDQHLWIFPNFTKSFSSRKPLSHPEKFIFLDIDGTIWPDQGPGQILHKSGTSFQDKEVMINKLDSKVVFVTNQTLFARSENVDLRLVLSYFSRVFRLCWTFGAIAFLVCHHHPAAQNRLMKKECNFRKPSHEMIQSFISKRNVDLNTSVFLGDRITDAKCSNLAGISNSILISNEKMFVINESESSNLLEYAFFSVTYKGFDDVESWLSRDV